MAATIGLVIDCTDPTGLARFWSQALGYTAVGGAGSYVMLADAAGVQPKLLLQAVPEAKAGKNRMHLDIEAFDVEVEASRLESFGARRIEAATRNEHGSNWVVMADPEGNEFCVCDGGTSGAASRSSTREAPTIDVSDGPHSVDEILASARARLDRVAAEDLERERLGGAVIVDTRPVEQRARDGEMPGAIVIDRNVLEWRLDPSCEHRIADIAHYDARIVVVCNEGYSSSLAAAMLHDIGLNRATDLIGGYQAWLAQADR